MESFDGRLQEKESLADREERIQSDGQSKEHKEERSEAELETVEKLDKMHNRIEIKAETKKNK